MQYAPCDLRPMQRPSDRASKLTLATVLARLLAAVLASMFILTLAGAAEPFPSKPISLLIPFPPGGGSDPSMRALGAAMGAQLKTPVVALNRPGATGTLAASTMAQTAAPDGYTISLVLSNIFRAPHLQKTTYDPVKDFTYIIGLGQYRFGIVVRADSKWKTLPELIAYAKANPGKLSYASVGTGGSGQIAMERLARAADIKVTFIPYKGIAEEMMALAAGDIDVVIDPGWGPYAISGKVRPLAAVATQRYPRFKDVPTLKELGWDIAASSQSGIVGPKGMDPTVVKTLHDALKKATQDPVYTKLMETLDVDQAYLSSADFTKFAAEQFERERHIVLQLGIKLN